MFRRPGRPQPVQTRTHAVIRRAVLETLETRRLMHADHGSTLEGQAPYFSVAFAVSATPVTIEAEHFDHGGQNVAYVDNSPGNGGGTTFRADEDVDLKPISGGGYRVLGTYVGEWVEYTINVEQSGTYVLDSRVSSMGSGGSFHIELRDVATGDFVANLTPALTFPKTGGHEKWTTLTNNVTLPAGTHVLRLAIHTNSTYGSAGNFDWIKFTQQQTEPPPNPEPGSQQPYHGIPFSVGATAVTIEAEHFDYGGQNVAYVDNSPGNGGGTSFRAGEDVDLKSISGGGYRVLGTYTGEWVEYTISVAQSGSYVLDSRVSSKGSGGSFHYELRDAASGAFVSSLTGNITIPNTGGHEKWTTLTNNVTLPTGIHVLRLAIDTNSTYGSAGNFDWIKLTSGQSSTPASGTATWQTVAPAPTAHVEANSAVVGGKLYLLGPFDALADASVRSDVYDPATNTWTRIADLPEPVTHAGVAVVGNVIYLTGGWVGDDPGPATNKVWKYDTLSNTWSAGPALPAARGAGVLIKLGDALHFLGGMEPDRVTDSASHWRLDLNNLAAGWVSAPNMPNPRNHLGGAAVGGKLYVIGGQHALNENTGNQDDVHVYDPVSKSWSQAADLPSPRGHIAASTFARNGRIVVVGGLTNDVVSLKDVIEYDPASNTWAAITPIPATRKSPIAGVIGGEIIVSGGQTTGSSPSSTTWKLAFSRKWEIGATIPVELGEVAGGVIGNKMYVLGDGSSSTYAYNLSTGAWAAVAGLTYQGDHYAAEVYNGKLYLIGGLGAASGKLQIFNPATNQWTLGADMPFSAGSSATALIGGMIYVAGGVVGSTAGSTAGTGTTNLAARYNPATNTWTMIASMPQGRNHAAAATDGQKMYVFGGRTGNNNTSNGYNTVQIYDPLTNTWESSASSGSDIAPLPIGRGGMGKAVYLNGEFYIMGGETKDGPGANEYHTYDRVDIYNPLTNSWRLGAPMPTARHGIFPLLHGGRIYVAGGGPRSMQIGYNDSNILEIYNPF